MPPLTPRQTRVRFAFLAIQGLFIASWSIWVPTFLLFLDELFPGNPAYKSAIVAIYLVFSCFLELPTGVVADRWGGYRTFAVSSLVVLLGNALYAYAPFEGDHEMRFRLAIAAEFLSALGVAFYSGSFDKWFLTALTRAEVVESSRAAFRLARTHRNLMLLVAGLVGIGLYAELRARGELLALDHRQLVWLPHLWAAVLVFVAFAVAWWAQASLVDPPRPGHATHDAPAETALGPLQTFHQAWSFLFRVPRLFSLTLVQAVTQIQITYAAFYVSQTVGSSILGKTARLMFWESHAVLGVFLAYWAVGRGVRVLGNWLSGDRVQRPEAWLLAHAAVLVAGALLLLLLPDWERAGLAQAVLVGLAGLSGFFLTGLVEVRADAETADWAPLDLLASIFSARSMIANLAAAVAFPLAALLSRASPTELEPVVLCGTLAAVSGIICTLAMTTPRGLDATLGRPVGLWSVWLLTVPVAAWLALGWPGLEQQLAPIQRLIALSDGPVQLLSDRLPPSRTIVAITLALGVLSVAVGTASLLSGPLRDGNSSDLAKTASLVAAFKSHHALHTLVLGPVGRALRQLGAGDAPAAFATLATVDGEVRRLIRSGADARGTPLVDTLDRLVQSRAAVPPTVGQAAPRGFTVGTWRSKVPDESWRVQVEYFYGRLPAEDLVDLSMHELDATLADAFSNAIEAVLRRHPTPDDTGLIRVTVIETDEVFWIYFADNGTGLEGRTQTAMELEGIRQGRLGLMSAGLLTRAGRLGYHLDHGPGGGTIARIWVPRKRDAVAIPVAPAPPLDVTEEPDARAHRG